jgi:hypothetical protein
MCIGCVAYFVNGFYSGIYCRIETDSKIGTKNILINSACNAYTSDIMLFATTVKILSRPDFGCP